MLKMLAQMAVLLGALWQNAAEAHDNSAAKCVALRATDFSIIPDAPTQILSSRSVGDDERAYCEVRGYVSPATGFELRLPLENWNGKFWMVGNGGSGGEIPAALCENRVRRGYACVATDMGHIFHHRR